MSYEQRKTKKKRKEIRDKAIAIVLGIIILIVISIYILKKETNKTIFPINDTFLKEIELQTIVIKDEKVFKTLEVIDKNNSILEGEKVPVGRKVQNSKLMKDLKSLKEELKEVKDAILILKAKDKNDVFKNDKDKLIEEHNASILKLQEYIYMGDYKKIKNMKKEIDLINKKIDKLAPQNDFLDQSIESLEEKSEELKKEINQNDSSNTTIFSGILSYELDGYEDVFKAQSFDSYTYDILKLPEEEIDDTGRAKTLKDFQGFKIINNFQWYLAIKIDDRKEIDNYNLGDVLHIKYPLKDNYLEIEGNIIAINNTSNRSVIVLKFNKYLHDFYNARFPKIKLIQENIEGLKIPKNTIFEQDGEKGVYIKDFSGIVKFRPIKTISTEGEYTYIEKGNKDLLISIDTRKESVRTVSIHDEILLKPNKFKENQILD